MEMGAPDEQVEDPRSRAARARKALEVRLAILRNTQELREDLQRIQAQLSRSMYESYKEAGYSKEQALDLVKDYTPEDWDE